MKILIASDHAGFELKEKLRQWLVEQKHEVKDFGAFSYSETDDYPDFIRPLAQDLAKNPQAAKGIILGGSGEGEAMAANRFKRVRAAVYYGGDEQIVKLSRQHNDANVLSLGARFISEEAAKTAIKLWLETDFTGEERHKRRIKKLDD
jgi:ribose 5-phosphate isomerase B